MKAELVMNLKDIGINAVGVDAGMAAFDALKEDSLYDEEDGFSYAAENALYGLVAGVASLGAGIFRNTANAVGRSKEAKYNLDNYIFDGHSDWLVYSFMGLDIASGVIFDVAKIAGELVVAGALGFIPGWLSLIGLHVLANGAINTPNVLSGKRRIGTYD